MLRGLTDVGLPARRRVREGWPLAVLTLIAALVLAVAAMGLALRATGALPTAAGPGLPDPGRLVRDGLPVARVLSRLAAAATLGLLVLGCWALPDPSAGRASRPPLRGARLRAIRYAGLAGLAWVLAGAAVAILSYADIAGTPVDAPEFGPGLASYLLDFDQGRAQAASLLLAFLAANGALLVTRLGGAGACTVLAVLALLPLALTGHSSEDSSHETAVTALAVHTIGATLWAGGLIGLVVLRSSLGPALPATVRRFSVLAGWCWILVVSSGVLNTALRVGDLADLRSGYGLLLAGKASALGVLGLAGWWHRRRLVRAVAAAAVRTDGRAGRASAAFWRLVTGEVLVLAATFGLAVALSRVPAPGGEAAAHGTDRATDLLGYPPPPPVTALRWLTEWRLDLLWLSVAAALLLAYLAGVIRLRRRGDRWPPSRQLAWVAGCIALALATNGAPGAYSRVSFSMHMIQHMTLSMLVPPLLVLGAPATLALRALDQRVDGSRGVREWLLAVLRSRPLAVVAHPVIAAGIFVGSLATFYYTPLFELALRTHTGHVLMTVHFLISGYLFASALIGVDPGPSRPAHPLRLLLLMVTMAFHAVFGVTLLSSENLLAGDWFQAVSAASPAALLQDQQNGGAIAWALGDIPALVLVLGVAWSWMRSDDREARRYDRGADRDGDAALSEYNAYLQRIARSQAPRR